MKYFLMLIIVGLGCGGYYEFTILQQQHAGDEQRLAELQAKLDPILADNQKLEADSARLTKSLTEAQGKVADLTQQLQAAQTALGQARQDAGQAPAGKDSAPPAGPTPAAPTASNNLGNITTLDGKSYTACQLLKVRADGIVVNDSNGITQVPYGLMPPDLQKRFDFDPHIAPSLTNDQVDALEAKRQAAAAAGN